MLNEEANPSKECREVFVNITHGDNHRDNLENFALKA
jgi:hypothetical protein